MQEHLIELSVGETLQVGQYKVTLLDVEGDELFLQVISDENDGWNFVGSPQDLMAMLV